MFKDYFSILNVKQSASVNEIRISYRRLAKHWHPDVNNSPQATGKMRDIIEAYDILSDNKKRQAYNVEYNLYYTTVNTERTAYVIKDVNLKEWIKQATKKANDISKQTLADVLNISIAGFKEAVIFLLKGILFMMLLSFFIGLIFFISQCNNNNETFEVRIINNLPCFTEKDGHSVHNDIDFGKFSIPATMEVKPNTDIPNNLLATNIVTRTTFQQKSGEAIDSTYSKSYARIIICKEKVSDNYTFIDINKEIKKNEFDKFNENLKQAIIYTFPGIYIDWVGCEIVNVNYQRALVQKYRGSNQVDPVIWHETYVFSKGNNFYTVAFSYYQKDFQLWEEDFYKVLSSLELYY